MTLQELNEHYHLRSRLYNENQTLRSLHDTAYPKTHLSDMPHAPGIKDRVGDLAVEIADLSERIRLMQEKADRQAEDIIAFVNTIDDGNMRTILRLRFLRCLTWGEVAAVIGGRNTEEGVKTACYRFLAP
ncbi:MAG TPA: hypothetical protein VN626_02835 [Clostridia bacterium]|nr:hypothetical protein [Clostridia bacterium]